ncbi:MAG TPA: hypothetical protein VF796_06045 [Humisphaera sp.]
MTLAPAVTTPLLRAGPAPPPAAMADVRRRMVLNGCKWDPQVGDVATLAPFPLLLSAETWADLAADAEALAAEQLAAERALVSRPDLHRRLGLPRRLRRAFRELADGQATPEAARILRFDFHPTPDGWRVSECNADVPGGFTEASLFPRLVAEHAGGRPLADVTAAWVDALAVGARRAARGGGVAEGAAADADAAEVGGAGPLRVALLAAPGFMEDRQIVELLAREFRRRGHVTWPAEPRLIDATTPIVRLRSSAYDGPVDLVVRFFQGEWLARLPRRHWHRLLVGGRTPVANGPAAILGESKRLPLLWDALGVAAPTWRRLLPETRDPRDMPWRADDAWLLKSAYCNNGDDVAHPAVVGRKAWRSAAWRATLRPTAWLAQRRFESVPVETPAGPMHACVGVYVIDGRACGAYGRLSPGPVIDYRAVDVAVLLDGAAGPEVPR